ncbi:MAG: hypothetical protein P8N76_20080 [Pirellulaceae bacterium]|nr:hypothetical protein [Pirellulaceae bacterium]
MSIYGDIRIAINDRPGSFSDRWQAFCADRNLSFKLFDFHASEIVQQVADYDIALLHTNLANAADCMSARHVIKALESMGLVVFPNSSTYWTYDDKVAQKYLLEAIDAPLIPSYVFFDEIEAHKWVDSTVFPKVFKLRRGAGATNVRLIKSRDAAHRIVTKAFSRGFRPMRGHLGDRISKLKSSKTRKHFDFIGKLRRFPRTFAHLRRADRLLGHDIGYVYFQDFLPNNDCDTRITIIGDHAFGFKRMVRGGDFRASGSGLLDYSPAEIDHRCLRIAFELTDRLDAQCLAFDFVNDQQGEPRVIEMSYAFVPEAVYNANGWWDRNLTWHEGGIWPQDVILQNTLDQLVSNRE